MEKIERQVQNAIRLYECKNIPALQQQLYELYSNFNQIGGGKLIINYPNKDQLAECFTMMLRFDWMNDNDIREVWAENGFYCIIEYLNKQASSSIDAVVGALNLFLHLCVAREHFKPKVQEVLNKAIISMNPIFNLAPMKTEISIRFRLIAAPSASNITAISSKKKIFR